MQNRLRLDGAKVRILRVQRSWPQEQLALIAEVSPRTIQRIEAGGNGSYQTLRSIAGAFEIEAKELLTQQLEAPPRYFQEATEIAEPTVDPAVMVRYGSRIRTIMTGTLWTGLLAGAISFLVYLPQLFTTDSERITHASKASPAPFLASPVGKALPGLQRRVQGQPEALVMKKRPERQRRTTPEVTHSPAEAPGTAPPNIATSFLVGSQEVSEDQTPAPQSPGEPAQELAVTHPINLLPEPEEEEVAQTTVGVGARTNQETGSGQRSVSEAAREFGKRTAGFFSRLGASVKKSF